MLAELIPGRGDHFCAQWETAFDHPHQFVGQQLEHVRAHYGVKEVFKN